jgi:hypothetical protein
MNGVSKLKLASWVLLVIGLVLTVNAQIQGTRSRAPDPAERMIWAALPFAILAAALRQLMRTRVHEVIALIGAALVALTSTMYWNDEMRLTYSLTPVFQLILVLVIVAGLVVDNVRLRRRERRASAG